MPPKPKYKVKQQVLSDFSATIDAKPNLTKEEIFAKFPEFGGDESFLQSAIDYHATAKSGKYKDASTLNAKFPEFEFEGSAAPTSTTEKKKATPSYGGFGDLVFKLASAGAKAQQQQTTTQQQNPKKNSGPSFAELENTLNEAQQFKKNLELAEAGTNQDLQNLQTGGATMGGNSVATGFVRSQQGNRADEIKAQIPGLQRQYQWAQQKIKYQSQQLQPEFDKLQADISKNFQQYFTKDGIIDTQKVLTKAGELSQQYGGGQNVKEVLAQRIREYAQFEQQKPVVNNTFEKAVQKQFGKSAKQVLQETPQEEQEATQLQLQKMWEQAYKQVAEDDIKSKQLIANILGLTSVGQNAKVGMAFVNGLNNVIASMGEGAASIGINNAATDWLRSFDVNATRYELPDPELSLKNILTDPMGTVATRVARQVGTQLPMIAATAVTRSPRIAAAMGWGSETFSLMGETYKEVLENTGNPAEARAKSMELLKTQAVMLPTYYFQANSLLKLGAGAKGAIANTAIESANDIFQEEVQGFTQAQLAGRDFTMKDAVNTAAETLVASGGMGAGMAGIGKAYKTISEKAPNVQEQHLFGVVQNMGVEGAIKHLENLRSTGQISMKAFEQGVVKAKAMETSINSMKKLNIDEDAQLATVAFDGRLTELTKQLEAEPNASVKAAISGQIAAAKKEIADIQAGNGNYAIVQVNGGGKFAIPMTEVGAFIDAEQDNIADGTTLVQLKGSDAVTAFGGRLQQLNDMAAKNNNLLSKEQQAEVDEMLKAITEDDSNNTGLRTTEGTTTETTAEPVQQDATATQKQGTETRVQEEAAATGQPGADGAAAIRGNEALRDVESTAKALQEFQKLAIRQESLTGSERTAMDTYYNILIRNGLKNAKGLSEVYHKAKADGSNPELVKAVEDLLGGSQQPSQPIPQSQAGPAGNVAVEGNEALRDVESTARALDNHIMSNNPQLKNSNFSKEAEDMMLKKMSPRERSEGAERASERLGKNGVPWVDVISEAYHKAKADGSNPELVKAVEDLLVSKNSNTLAQDETAKVQPERTGNGTGRNQGRSLAPLEGAPTVQGASGPDPNLVAVAEKYAEENGITLKRQAEYAVVNEEFAKRIAAAYDEMAHAPNDPAVKDAYANLIKQTKAQYEALVAAGYEFTFFDSETDPYEGNPYNAMRDLRQNKRMAVYGTYDGYGTEGVTNAEVENNPMLEDTGLRWKDQNGVERPVTANDLFRAVHDAFGHGLEGSGFRARGEENAWQAHVRLFTGSAIAAITTETRGQNSWLNFGPYGEANRNAKVEDTVFAEQKTGLMPEWTWMEGRVGDMENSAPASTATTSPSPITVLPRQQAAVEQQRNKEQVLVVGTKKPKTIAYENGERVVLDSSGNKLDPEKESTKQVLRQHAEAYQYDFGETVPDEAWPQTSMGPNDVARFIAENSNNPAEIAAAYQAMELEARPMSSKQAMIAEAEQQLGTVKVTMDAYAEFGDRNNMNSGIGRFRIDANARSLDQQAQEISWQLGDESGTMITPEDLAEYITDFPMPSTSTRKSKTAAHATAENRFLELTGIPLTPKVAEIASQQFAQRPTPQQLEAAFDYPADVWAQIIDEEIDNLADYEQYEQQQRQEDVSATDAEQNAGTPRTAGENEGADTGAETQSDGSGRAPDGGQGPAVGTAGIKLDSIGARTDVAAAEKKAIVDKAKANGTYLKAPNGQPTKLTPDQWATVRTKAFKEWFGDWENDPANASKVVDENGEPMVVYHGSPSDFDVFDYARIGQQGRAEGAGFYFTKNKSIAEQYGTPKAVFLAIKNPAAFNRKGFTKATLARIIKRIAELEAKEFDMEVADGFLSNFGDIRSKGLQSVVNEAATMIADDETILDQLGGIIGSGVNVDHVNLAVSEITSTDGFVSNGFRNEGSDADQIYVTLLNNQIKSATDNSGAFSKDSSNIKLQLIGNKGAAALDAAEGTTVRMDNLQVAKDMEAAGKDVATIRLATGWEKGVDGMWRYEVMDIALSDTVFNSIFPDAEYVFDEKYMLPHRFVSGGNVIASAKSKELLNDKKIELLRNQTTDLQSVISDSEVFSAYPFLKKVIVKFVRPISETGTVSGSYFKDENGAPTIILSPDLLFDKQLLKSVISHEVQHAIQDVEGFSKGGNPSMFADSTELSADQRLFVEGALALPQAEALQRLDDMEASEVFSPEEAAQLREAVNAGPEALRALLNGAFDQYQRLAGEVEARNVQARMGMTAEQRRQTPLAATEDVARDRQIVMADTSSPAAFLTTASPAQLEQAGLLDDMIAKAQRALQQILPGVQMQVAETLDDYAAVVRANLQQAGQTDSAFVDKASTGSFGIYIPGVNKIVINKAAMKQHDRNTTGVHEVVHPIVTQAVNGNTFTLERLAETILTLQGKGIPGVDAAIDHAFNKGYQGKQTIYDELVTEFLTQVVAGKVDVSKIDKSLIDQVIDVINKVMELLGISYRIQNPGDLQRLSVAVNELFNSGDKTMLEGAIGKFKTAQQPSSSLDAIPANQLNQKLRDYAARSLEAGKPKAQVTTAIKNATLMSDEEVAAVVDAAERMVGTAQMQQPELPGLEALRETIVDFGREMRKAYKRGRQEGGSEAAQTFREYEQMRTRIRGMITDMLKTARKLGVLKDGDITPDLMAGIIRRLTNAKTSAGLLSVYDYLKQVLRDVNYDGKLNRANAMAGRIKNINRSKNISKNAAVREAVRQFTNINPAKVSDIDAYLATAEKILNTVQGIKVAVKDFGNAPDVLQNVAPSGLVATVRNESPSITLQEIQDYVEQQQNHLLQRAEDALIEQYADYVAMGIIDPAAMTLEEMQEMVNLIDAPTDGRATAAERMAVAEKKLEEMRKAVGYNQMGLDDAYTPGMTDSERKIVDNLRLIDVEKLNAQELAKLNDAINNIIINNDYHGAGEIAQVADAQQDAVAALEAIKKAGMEGKMGDISGKFKQTLASKDLLLQFIYRLNKLTSDMQRFIGVHDIMKGYDKAMTLQDKAVKRIDDLKKQLRVKDIDSPLNRYRRGVYADVANNFGGTDAEIQAEFDRRKAWVKATAERLLSSKKAAEQREGELVKQVYDELLEGAATLADVQAKMQPYNMAIVQEWQAIHAERKEYTKEHAEQYNNLMWEDVENYTSTKLKSVDGNKDADAAIDQFDKEFIARGLAHTLAGAKNKKIRAPQPPKGRILNFDFDTVQARAFYETNYDVEVANSIAKFKAILRHPDAEKIFGSTDNKNAVLDNVRATVLQQKGKNPPLNTVGRFAEEFEKQFLRRLQAAGARIALGSITQPLKQYPSVAINTLVNLGKDMPLFGRSIREHFKNQDALNRLYEQFNIGQRGATQAGYNKDVDFAGVDPASFNTGAAKASEVAGKVYDKVNETLLAPLQFADVRVARHSWLAYYMQDLKRQGRDITNINWDAEASAPSNEAAAYAEQMVSRTQNPNDPTSMAALFKERGALKLFVRALMPFSTFSTNMRMRFVNDVEKLTNGTPEAKKEGLQSLVATGIEQLAFNALKVYLIQALIQQPLVEALAKGFGIMDDDEEDDDNYKDPVLNTIWGGQYQSNENLTKVLSNSVSDYFFSGLGSKVQMTGNYLMNKVYAALVDETYKDGKVSKNPDLYFMPGKLNDALFDPADWGMYGIAVAKAMEAVQNADEAYGYTDLYYKDNDKSLVASEKIKTKKAPIPEEFQRAYLFIFLVNSLSLAGVGDAELSQINTKLKRKAEKKLEEQYGGREFKIVDEADKDIKKANQ